MAIDKMDSSAVYELFEELKQLIKSQENRALQVTSNDSPANYGEIESLAELLRNFANQKSFTPEQVKELQENLAQFSAYALKKSFEKLDEEFPKVIDILTQINDKCNSLNVPANFVIRKEHAFSIDFKNSKAAITMMAMGLLLFFSVGWNIWQSNRNGQLKNNDLKYRYVKMQGEANQEDLLNLETVFTYNRNKNSIAIIRKRVEAYERLVKEQSEKIERARLNAREAERLEKEAESVKSRK